ncbi:hypothetical protein A2U01_0051865, partial [Trifolium medium]|nr:hypothetical protein [Trifolium medium]
MGHAENRCEIRFAMESDDGSRELSNELRAEPRRTAGRQASRWLVEERGGGSGSRGGSGGPTYRGSGDMSGARQNSGESSMQGPTNFNVQQNSSGNTIITNHNSQINPNQCSAT